MKKNKKHYDKYKKFDVVYADFGRNPHGVQGGIRPGIVVSCDASNHGGAPQISVVPLSSKLKDNPTDRTAGRTNRNGNFFHAFSD